MKRFKLKYLIFSVLILLSILSVVSNYKLYQSYINQHILLTAVMNGEYTFSDEYAERISSGYPSLSATDIPLKSMMGAYWINKDSLDLGLEYLRQGNRDNPYIGFSDMIFANVYQSLGMKDSFSYYTRKAYQKLPNNPAHYALLGRIYVEEGKIDSLDLIFKEITSRVPDREVWRLYLSAMVYNKYSLDTIEVYENAKKAKSIFPDNKQLNLTADYVLYGVENVKKSIVLNQIAIDTFDIAPSYSIKAIKEAIELVPDNMTYYETLIEVLFRQNMYSDVIEVYDRLNELNMTRLQTIPIEFISISYLNLNDLGKGCYLAKILNDSGHQLSPEVVRVCYNVLNPN